MSRWQAVPLAAVALAGLLLVGCGGPGQRPAAAPSSRAVAATADRHEPPGVAGFHSVRTYDQPAPPARLEIPAIGVSTPLVRLGRLPDGTIEVPHAWNTAGWYDQGPRPGQPGPAVLLGHVDSKKGPAVFYRLRDLRPGDIVRVGLTNGRTLVFRVQRTERYPKDRFPTEAVYFPTLDRALRLITCGGDFDYAKGSYVDNIVVYAILVT
ncbi:MAG TPA: class F sortase [Streptosporangiaceae bacterium]|nr:class F sortase [Streptosporangiaceae bacterium]